MDLNQIGEGATVYLPVFQLGAMLFLGDGHALQGDGETTQWALETSLDVEFSVEILSARPLSAPRVETADRITVLGQATSLDEAVRAATGGMVQWLEQDYGLTVSEASMILVAAAPPVASLARNPREFEFERQALSSFFIDACDVGERNERGFGHRGRPAPARACAPPAFR